MVIMAKYFLGNCTIYDTTPTTLVPEQINPLTGRKVKVEYLSSTENKPRNNYITASVEYKRLPENGDKYGLKSGEVLLQGRIVSWIDPNTITYSGVTKPQWYQPGGKYIVDCPMLGKGHWYALEVVPPEYKTAVTKYFGYPIMGKFVRLNQIT